MKTNTFLCFILFIIPATVLYGWFEKQEVYLTWGVSVHIITSVTTAICLCLLALSLYFVMSDVEKNKQYKQVASALFGAWITCILTIAIYSRTFGNDSIFESLFIETIQSNTGGTIPSVATMLCLYALSLVPWIYIYNTGKLYRRLQIIGISVATISGLTMLGHALNIPILYFSFEVYSTGMSIVTSTCLMISSAILMKIADTIKLKKLLQ